MQIFWRKCRPDAAVFHLASAACCHGAYLPLPSAFSPVLFLWILMSFQGKQMGEGIMRTPYSSLCWLSSSFLLPCYHHLRSWWKYRKLRFDAFFGGEETYWWAQVGRKNIYITQVPVLYFFSSNEGNDQYSMQPIEG